MLCCRLHATSSAVKSEPSWNLTPSLTVNSQLNPSLETTQSVRIPGANSLFPSTRSLEIMNPCSILAMSWPVPRLTRYSNRSLPKLAIIQVTFPGWTSAMLCEGSDATCGMAVGTTGAAGTAAAAAGAVGAATWVSGSAAEPQDTANTRTKTSAGISQLTGLTLELTKYSIFSPPFDFPVLISRGLSPQCGYARHLSQGGVEMRNSAVEVGTAVLFGAVYTKECPISIRVPRA